LISGSDADVGGVMRGVGVCRIAVLGQVCARGMVRAGAGPHSCVGLCSSKKKKTQLRGW
jgi:hypothetical protein